MKEIITPVNTDIICSLKMGEIVYITGIIYTARDAAHKRLYELICKNKKLPLNLQDQIIYYTGPTPVNKKTGYMSAGPTTSSRMDFYTPCLLKKTGIKVIIGKGNRSKEVIRSLISNKAVYFATYGGLGALLGKCIKKSGIVCYKDLGPEAIYKFEVEKFPCIVAIDVKGNNIYEKGPQKYINC
jgi:fumarate hydratase subunit beta